MKIFATLMLAGLSLAAGLSYPGCSSDSSRPMRNMSLYPACEPRSNTDPGRLNLRAGAEHSGTVPPCRGTLSLYINKNSVTRSLDIGLQYLDREGDLLAAEQIRVDLQDTRSGMYQNEVALRAIEGEICWKVQLAVQSISCYSADGDSAACPQVRIHQPDAFDAIKVEDNTLDVCNANSNIK